MRRPVTAIEKSIIQDVATRLPAAVQRQLLEDLANATAESAGVNGSRVLFHIAGYDRAPYRGQHSFGVGGTLLDKDGGKISFDLFADEKNRLLEYELVRWAEGALIEPNWGTFKCGYF